MNKLFEDFIKYIRCELNLSVHTVSSYSVDISQWLQFAAANALGCPKGSRPDDVDHAAVTVADLMALAEPSPEPVPEPLPEPEPEPATEPEPEPKPEKSGGAGTLLLVLAVLALGGGAGWYFKIYRPKQQAAAPGEDFDEAEEYGEDYGGGEYDDLPPWDEEEEKEDGE